MNVDMIFEFSDMVIKASKQVDEMFEGGFE